MIIFGVWLAISLDGVKVWDAWVIVAIVLLGDRDRGGPSIGSGVRPGDRARERARRAGRLQPDAELASLARTRKGMTLHLIATVAEPCWCSST